MSDTTKSKVAVFFDYENIVYSLRNRFEQKANFEALMTKCNEFGTVVEARAFADWGLPYMSPALMYALQSSGFDLIFVPTGSTQANSPRKNVADLYMAIHVMEVLHARPEISTFVLMTGDRDFMPLVNHLKRSGKHVVAIGVDGSSSYYLTQSVDDFFYYSEVEQIFEEKPKRLKGRLTNAYDALVQSIRVTYEKGKAPRMTNLKPIMIDLMNGFDEKEYQDTHGRYFLRFKDFVREAQRRGLVRIVKRGSTHEVYLADRADQKRARIKRGGTPEGEPIGLQVAYKLLVQAVKEADEQGKSFRMSAIRTRLRRLHQGFNEQLVYNGGGKPFETFTDFTQSAEKAGLVEIHGSGSSFEIRPIGEAEPERREVSGGEARGAVLHGLRAYTNYPTSFLSLASFVHRHNEQQGLKIEEQLARNLMTEAVEIGLIKQIVLENGRRKYAFEDQSKLSETFLQATYKAEEPVADAPAADETDETKGAAGAKPVVDAPASTVKAPAKSAPLDAYTALTNAIQQIASDGKVPILARIKSNIKKQIPGFSESTLNDRSGNPFIKFKDFVLDAEQRGIVRIIEEEGAQPRVAITNPAEALLRDGALAEAKAAINAATSTKSAPATEGAITQDDLSAVVAATIEIEDSAETKSKPAKTAPPIAPPAHLSFKRISENEQRELMVEGMQGFSDYPAPFMAILAHCRGIRDTREVFVSNNDLRELLSEGNKVGLLARTTSRGTYPTLYTYNGDEALVTQFVEPPQTEPVVEEEEAVAEVEETPVVVETVVEPEPEPVVETPEPVAKPQPVASDSELRQFVIATLRNLSDSGMQFKEIETMLKAARDEAALAGSNQRLKSLLQFASRRGILDVVSPYGMRPRLFSFTKNEAAVNTYLGILPEPEPTPEPAPEPAAEAVEEVAEVTEVQEVVEVVEVEEATEAAKAEETPEAVVVEEVAEAVVAEVEAESENTVEAETSSEESAVDHAYAVLIAAVTELVSEGKSTGFGTSKRRMTKLNNGFDEKVLSNSKGKLFKRFKDFVLEAQALGHVTLDESGKNILLVEQASAEVEVLEVAETEAVAEAPAEAVEEAAPTSEATPAEEAVIEPVEAEAVVEETTTEAVVEEAATEPVVESVEAVVESAEEATEAVEPTETAVEPVEAVAEPVEVIVEADELMEATVVEETIEEAVAEAIAEASIEVEAEDPLTTAYKLLRTAVSDAIAAGRSQRLPAIRTRMMRLDAAFDIAALYNSEGRRFKSMPDFIRSAEAAGYVRLEGKGAQLAVFLAE